VVSEDMAMRLRAEVEGLWATHPRIPRGVRVRAAEIVEAASDDRWDTIAVRFTLDGDRDDGASDGFKVVDATEQPWRWDQVWWFQRAAGAKTPSNDTPLDRCPWCGAPVEPMPGGECAYCQRQLGRPSTWVLTRTVDVEPDYSFSNVTIIPDSARATVGPSAGMVRGVIALVVILSVVPIVVSARRAGQADREIPSFNVPSSFRAHPGTLIPGANLWVVLAPVDYLPAAAAAAVVERAGRPLVVAAIQLHPDGRIAFEVQAVNDPTAVDSWLWKDGKVTGPEPGLIPVDPTRLYPLTGVDLTSLARLCDAALRATGVAGGVVQRPYLVKVGADLRWHIPVESLSSRSASKTYRVAPDGTGAEVL